MDQISLQLFLINLVFSLHAQKDPLQELQNQSNQTKLPKIEKKNSKKKKWKKISFITLNIHDRGSQDFIMEQLAFSESFDHFVSRIMVQGSMDLTGSNDSSTRTPIGRCWRLFKSSQLVGCILDYPGQFSTLKWQPCFPDLHSDEFCMSVYVDESSDLFEECLIAFQTSKDINSLREKLSKMDYLLDPKLYTWNLLFFFCF